jgi:hypothetical protein
MQCDYFSRDKKVFLPCTIASGPYDSLHAIIICAGVLIFGGECCINRPNVSEIMLVLKGRLYDEQILVQFVANLCVGSSGV